jgi:hypothetical protein
MRYYNKLRAILIGKKFFTVPSLNRVVLSANIKVCQARFARHLVRKATIIEKARFLFGM